MVADAIKKHSDQSFATGDLVYVKLQPCRQKTIANRKCLKSTVSFFGPFQVVEKIGNVAYELALPNTARVHPVFHMSQLKKHIGTTPV